MPIFTSQNIKADVARKIHGAVSESFFGSLNEGARQFLNTVDAYETKRRTTIESALYDQVDKYYLPIDLKDQKIIDIRKQILTDRTYRDSFDNVSNRTFDKYNSGANGVGAWRTFTIEANDNVKFIRIKDNLQNTTLILNTADSLTNNGSWNVYGSVSNLRVDNLNYLTGVGSLRFDIGTTTSGALEDADITPVDLTNYLVSGALFTWLYLPNPTSMTNVTLKWGSSAVDYNSFTVTAPHNNTVWMTGWNLLKFPLDGYQVFGNPNNAAINRLRLEFQTTGGPMPSVRIDNIVARQGIVYGMEYYSEYLFSDPITGLWKPQSFDLSDNINLSTTSYNLLMLLVSVIEAQEVRNSQTDVNQLKADFREQLGNYLASNKSEFIKPTETWYKQVDPTRSQFYSQGLGSY